MSGPPERVSQRWSPSTSGWPVNWGWIKKEGLMPVEVLTLSEAARRLGIPGREMVQIVYERAIRYVMVDGIPHIPEDALDEYRLQAS